MLEEVENSSPKWSRRSSNAEHFSGVLDVDAQLPVFAGHFPGNPLLPGVVQIDWALTATADTFNDLPATAFSGMSRIKFKTPVRPGSQLALELARHGNTVSFVYRSEGSVCTEGRLHYDV